MGRKSHTPEPWEYDEIKEWRGLFGPNRPRMYGIIKASNGSTIVNGSDWQGGRQKANLRRAAVCVNACKGIPTAALEAGVVGKLLEVSKKLVKATRPRKAVAS